MNAKDARELANLNIKESLSTVFNDIKTKAKKGEDHIWLDYPVTKEQHQYLTAQGYRVQINRNMFNTKITW